ncbi:alpha/beta hydrolase [Chryseobacterium koreense]|uniref:alpha/beta hydrolase n=1 Tax=Chryseobacterium koreense TaxID=232216 RepID=UPI0026F1C8AC|nr:alpha/beta hydrolase [Chryseobacterium koreense]
MKVYVISGMGADFKVLEKLRFPENLEVVFLDWLIPEYGESLHHYVKKMADRIDDSEPFFLLGYSFGGVIAQEIDKLKPAEKIVILGSIKSRNEMSGLIKFGKITKLSRYLPEFLFNERSAVTYSFFRKLVDPKNPKVMEYFTVRNPYYLKWCVDKMSGWKSTEINPKVVQVLADHDIVFPAKYSKPEYIVKNATHLFPITKPKEVSRILAEVFSS